MAKTVKVAAVQAEPVWNDLQGSVDKTISLIQDASRNGANVIGFPEVFIPGYPWSIWAHDPISNSEHMNEYFHASLARDSDEMKRICAAVKEANAFVVLGYSERYEGSLYIAQSFINENGDIVLHRRKIKPTHVERAYWGEGQGDSLQIVTPSKFGNIGGLNCWEHTQPLLRYYEYMQGVDIHVASWPPIWPSDYWPQHVSPSASQNFSRTLSMEGACFVLLSTQVMSHENKERNRLQDFPFARCPGGGFSMIYSPFGEELVKPLGDGEEGILYADVELNVKTMAKQNLDIVGHYSRPDLLSLRVNTHPSRQVFWAEQS